MFVLIPSLGGTDARSESQKYEGSVVRAALGLQPLL